MDEGLLADANWGPEEHAFTVQVMKDLDGEAMRFKLEPLRDVQVVQGVAGGPGPTRQTESPARCVGAEETRGPSRPLGAKRRQLWPRYCIFARPISYSTQREIMA